MLQFLLSFINASKLAGWVRAGVASGLGLAIAKWPVLKEYLDPAVQNALGVAAAGIIVGIWQHIAKSVDGTTAANANAAINLQPGSGR